MAEMTKRDVIANALRKDILTGKYGSLGGIPDEGELARSFSCARNTVVAALTLLEGERLVVHRGRSYYVNNLPIVMTENVPAAYVRRMENRYVKNIGSIERLHSIPEYLAQKLNIPIETPVVSCARIVGEVVNGAEIPERLSLRYYFLKLSDEKVQNLRDDSAYAPEHVETPQILGSIDEVTARLGTKEETDALKLPSMTAVLNLFETIRDVDGNLVMVHETTIAPGTTLIFGFTFTKPK